MLEGEDEGIEEAIANPSYNPDGLPIIALPYLILTALAYIGCYEEARQTIKSLIDQPYSQGYETLIYESLISPTYWSDNSPIML